jgi:RNA polymerase sigma-70 factor (ECF subfamily)
LDLTRGNRDAASVADDVLITRAARPGATHSASDGGPAAGPAQVASRTIVRNEADARDATQDAFVSAWQNLPRLRDERRFNAWLNTILANRCRDLLRRRGRIREIDLEGAALRVADPAPHALERAAVLAAFDRLSIADRQILALHHLEERPLDQIARALGIPVGTAKSRLHAARKALGRALETPA